MWARGVEDTENFLGFEVATFYKLWFLRGEVMQKISMKNFRNIYGKLFKINFSSLWEVFIFVWKCVESSTSCCLQYKHTQVCGKYLWKTFERNFASPWEVFIFVWNAWSWALPMKNIQTKLPAVGAYKIQTCKVFIFV